MRESVDSKAYLVTFLMKIPYMILWGLTGAVLGSGLYLLITAVQNRTPEYVCEKEFYIDFAYDKAKDYYNDYTWNDVLEMDPLLGKVMEKVPESYAREDIKEMIDADVLSDIRYLTITFTGKNQELVALVSNELSIALQEFGHEMKEFSQIREMEKGEVHAKPVKGFTLRAALLGLIVSLGLYIFCFSWKFSLLDAFYVRKDIERILGIPALERQESLTQDVVTVDFSKPVDQFFLEQCTKEVVLWLPQQESCRQEVEEFLLTAKHKKVVIKGALLVNCNRKWLSLYGIKQPEVYYQCK